MTDKQVRFLATVAKLILQCQIEDIKIVCYRFITTLEQDLDCFLKKTSEIDPRIYPTMHMMRLAMDFFIIKDGLPTWNPDDYQRFGTIAEGYGLKWGFRWAALRDAGHVEYQDGA